MKADDIVRQLFSVVPKITGMFSDEYQITSLVRSGSTVTATTSANHLMSTGDYVNIVNALTPVTISSLTREIQITSIIRDGQIATVTTDGNHNLPDGTNLSIAGALQPEYNITTDINVTSKNTFTYLVNGLPASPATGTILLSLTSLAIAETVSNHDLTLSKRIDGKQLTVDIDGADQPEYNGVRPLIAVPNRRKFIYEITGNPSSPGTGAIFLRTGSNTRDYNGRFEATVTSPTTFTYQITSMPESPAQGAPLARVRNRISRSERLSRAADSYTRQPPGDYWAYVVLENPAPSQSRATVTDATARISIGTAFRQPRIEQFSVYVFAPTTDEIAAGLVRDTMPEVASILFKSLLGVKLPTAFSNHRHDGVIWSGEANVTDNPAYYIHQFVFETTVDITACDIIENEDSVAFRDIEIDYMSEFKSSDNIIMQSDINLDEDPL